VQPDAQHELLFWFVRYLELVRHVEEVECQHRQLPRVAYPVRSWTPADDHVSVADSFDFVDVVQIDTCVKRGRRDRYCRPTVNRYVRQTRCRVGSETVRPVNVNNNSNNNNNERL